MLWCWGWSVANIVGSGIATNTSKPGNALFHQMNVMWGGINLAIATLGYIPKCQRKINNPTPLQAGVLKHYRTEP